VEGQITLKALVAWHHKRAQDCLKVMARATNIPKREREALISMAQFHQVAVRLLQTVTAAERM
jgi:hypothetical protein